MASAWMLEQPVMVHTRPAIELDDEEFFQFCRVNRDLHMERSADGDTCPLIRLAQISFTVPQNTSSR
jgi:hypothetical protein